jgi:hypothetical protein
MWPAEEAEEAEEVCSILSFFAGGLGIFFAERPSDSLFAGGPSSSS